MSDMTPTTYAKVETVPAALSGTVWAVVLPALANMGATVSQFTPHRWQDWAAFIIQEATQTIIIWAVVWFNRKSIIPPGAPRQGG